MPRRPLIILPEQIETREDIVRFFLFLDLVDYTIAHPDDRFWTREGGVQHSDNRGDPAYTVAEAKLRDRLMKQAWKVASREGLDIYEIALFSPGSPDNPLESAPEWIQKAVAKVLGSGSRKYWDPGEGS